MALPIWEQLRNVLARRREARRRVWEEYEYQKNWEKEFLRPKETIRYVLTDCKRPCKIYKGMSLNTGGKKYTVVSVKEKRGRKVEIVATRD